MSDRRSRREEDPFLLKYSDSELQIASEFLSTWFPFLSRDLCTCCTRNLSNSIRSLDPATEVDIGPSQSDEKQTGGGCNGNCNADAGGSWKDDGADTNSIGSWKDGDDANSLGSWKDGNNGWSEQTTVGDVPSDSQLVDSPSVRMSWVDIAQEDKLEQDQEEEEEVNKSNNRLLVDGRTPLQKGGQGVGASIKPKVELPREQREYIHFMNVRRKKDFVRLERVDGRIVNILDGLELHTNIFSSAEQKWIVDYVYALQEMDTKGKLRERTYSAPLKWKRGKGRVTIQFGCCYNYATDKQGNQPGILKNENVDPIPHLFKGDCIPPHIDNHDFVRPFCMVSFLSECNIVFGTNLKPVSGGEFSGPAAIPLPVGPVLVLNGNGADVAKHCVPALISITFRRMEVAKRPVDYAPEPDLQGLEPLGL
ncbi:hypothetical protein RJ641_010920 [Dillenia turbinata]|uniref:Fe2OG dioxygenase domain-containing protein n=1 Tax=Dillenia turbinata TaxID=194707 RepID=A0AAN8V3G1_9MAGN